MRPAMKSAVETMLGLASNGGAVDWKGKRTAGYQRPGVRIDMTHTPGRALGEDEERRVNGTNPEVDDQIVTISGPRQFTWTIRCEADSQEDAAIASGYADKIRARLSRDSVRAALRAAGLAVVQVSKAQPVEFKFQGRDYSVVVLDVVMNAVENDRDDTSGSGNWIKTVDVASKKPNASEGLIDVDGDPATSQISEVISR
jgi:hypothetical protein